MNRAIAAAVRFWYRAKANACWWDNYQVKGDIRHTTKLIVQLERELRYATRQRHIAELQAALRSERAHLAGLHHSRRENDEIATRAAMRARI